MKQKQNPKQYLFLLKAIVLSVNPHQHGQTVVKMGPKIEIIIIATLQAITIAVLTQTQDLAHTHRQLAVLVQILVIVLANQPVQEQAAIGALRFQDQHNMDVHLTVVVGLHQPPHAMSIHLNLQHKTHVKPLAVHGVQALIHAEHQLDLLVMVGVHGVMKTMCAIRENQNIPVPEIVGMQQTGVIVVRPIISVSQKREKTSGTVGMIVKVNLALPQQLPQPHPQPPNQTQP